MKRNDSSSSKKYFTNSVSVNCQNIQQQKNELLLSLSKFFKQQITKDVLKTELATIKTNLKTTCV
jgi:hypothetical protein